MDLERENIQLPRENDFLFYNEKLADKPLALNDAKPPRSRMAPSDHKISQTEQETKVVSE